MDWNNDGILDLVFGEREGHLNLYTGNGDGTLHFIGHIFDDSDAEIMTGFNSSPFLVDWNEDGKLDLLLTGYLTETVSGGIVRVYPCSGDNPDSPVFDSDYIDYTGFYNLWRTTAHPYDLDRDGDKDLVLGYEMGNVYFASNTGTNEDPQFTSYVDLQCDAGSMNVYTTFPGGGRARENVFDYNSDGIPDVLAGCSSGWIYVFLGYELGIGDVSASDGMSLSILESPSRGIFAFELVLPDGGLADITVWDLCGRTIETMHGLEGGPGVLDLSASPSGAYLVTATSCGETVSTRLVKLGS